jgi:uncharacterized membrane protein
VSTYELLLYLHILGVFGLIAAAGISTAVGIRTGFVRDTRVIATLLDLQHRTEWFVTLPSGALTVIAGSLLVDEAGYEYSADWVETAYTLFIVVLALDFFGLLRRNRRLRAQAQTLIDHGVTESQDLRRAAGAPIGIVMGALLDISFLVFLYLMVAKPGN